MKNALTSDSLRSNDFKVSFENFNGHFQKFNSDGAPPYQGTAMAVQAASSLGLRTPTGRALPKMAVWHKVTWINPTTSKIY